MAEIKKILIANRGEIVQRAIRTIKELGKKSVAVYSAGDKDASYLKHADEAVCIGPAKSADSYLSIPAIIAAAEMTGCDAIFPGYGFLSENQDFVEICKLHKIKFIGPSVEVMDLMADKSKAKEVITPDDFELLPIEKLWLLESQNSKESIFSVQLFYRGPVLKPQGICCWFFGSGFATVALSFRDLAFCQYLSGLSFIPDHLNNKVINMIEMSFRT